MQQSFNFCFLVCIYLYRPKNLVMINIFANNFTRFSVDGIPIREFKNEELRGVPFPKNQPMRIHSSLWNADNWATRGGLVKTDWNKAPFTASYTNFNDEACVVAPGKPSSCGNPAWLSEALDNHQRRQLKWVKKNYMVYNYCSDSKRFPQGYPPECNMR